MSNELQRELLLYCEFERKEPQRLLELTKTSTKAGWDAMTKKQQVKSYRAVIVDGQEVWSEDVVKAIFCSCSHEAERLREAKSLDAFKVPLKCGGCMARGVDCLPKTGLRADRFGCAQCAKLKNACNREEYYMYHKFRETWLGMDYMVTKDDLVTWYREVMKKPSKFVIREGRKVRAEDEEEEEEEDGNGVGESQGGDGGEEEEEVETHSPLKLKIRRGKTSKKPEDPVLALKARISELQGNLTAEKKNSADFMNRKLHYKRRIKEAGTKLLNAEQEVEKLREAAAAKKAKVIEQVPKIKLLESTAGEIERLRLEKEGFQREREGFQREREEFQRERERFQSRMVELEKLKDAELRREELRTRLSALEKKWEVRRAELVEKVKLMEQGSETSRLEWKEQLRAIEGTRDTLQGRVVGLETALRESGRSASEGIFAEDHSTLVEDGSAVLSLLTSTLSQNGELRDHLEAFQTANFRVRSLLEAAKESARSAEYKDAAMMKSMGLATRALLLPLPVVLSPEVERFQKCLEGLKAGGGYRGSKWLAEGSEEGSEERRKRVHGLVNL